MVWLNLYQFNVWSATNNSDYEAKTNIFSLSFSHSLPHSHTHNRCQPKHIKPPTFPPPIPYIPYNPISSRHSFLFPALLSSLSWVTWTSSAIFARHPQNETNELSADLTRDIPAARSRCCFWREICCLNLNPDISYNSYVVPGNLNSDICFICYICLILIRMLFWRSLFIHLFIHPTGGSHYALHG